MTKTERLKAIRAIVSQQKIRTQQDLSAALAQQGISLTQATISRLMAELGVVKFSDADGQFYYGFPGQPLADDLAKTTILAVQLQDQWLNIQVVPGTSRLVKRQLLGEFATGIFSLIADDDSLFLVATSPDVAQAIFQTIAPDTRGTA